MEAARSSRSLTTCQTVWYHNPEDQSLNLHSHLNLRCHIIMVTVATHMRIPFFQDMVMCHIPEEQGLQLHFLKNVKTCDTPHCFCYC